jgi:predicted nuclease of predicted toxin-antitoxin system
VELLADECCPRSIVAALRRAGHDVIHIQDDDNGTGDVQVALIAQRQDRVLVTEDYDFGELVVRHGVRDW